MNRLWKKVLSRCAKSGLASLVCFFALAIVLTWPVARGFSSELAIGIEPAPTVPLFNLWTLWWNCDRWNHGLAGYWDAPIFFPERGTFAFSEPQPLSGLVVWILSHVLPSLTACYHAILLTNLTLNGWLSMRLLSRLRVGRVTALAGGCGVAALPLIHWQLGVLQLTAVWPVIWSMSTLHDAARRPNWRRGLVFGLALATTYLTCHYYALMLGTLLVGTAWILVRPSAVVRQIGALLVGAFAAAAIVLPFAWTEIGILRERQLGQSREFVHALSITPAAYANTPWPQWLNPPISNLAEDGSRWGASPGSIKALFALCGVGWGLYRRSLRRWTLFLLVWLALSFLLSLGTRFQLGNVTPFEWLIRFVPGYSFFRSPFRFALFAQVAAALLAALGIDGVARLASRLSFRARGRVRWIRRWEAFRAAAVVALGVCAVVEAWPPQPQRFPMPDYHQPPAWAVWLERSTPHDAVFAFIPFPSGTSSWHYQSTAHWMCWQMVHHRRMVNGYSGLFPKSYLDLNQLMAGFPSPQSVDRLESQSVDYCVVVGPLNEQLSRNVDKRFELVFADVPNATSVYRLRADENATARSVEKN